MQKVVYSISKVNKDEKLKGVGYLVEGNLLIPSTSSKGNAYIRVFEDVTEKCKAVANSDNEFKGYVTVAYENIHVFNKEKNHYDTFAINTNGLRTATADNIKCFLTATNKVQALKHWLLSFGFVRPVGMNKTF